MTRMVDPFSTPSFNNEIRLLPSATAIIQAQPDRRLEALGQIGERRRRPGVQAMRVADDDIEAVREVFRTGGGRGTRLGGSR